MKTYNHIRLILFLAILTGAAAFDLFGFLGAGESYEPQIEAAGCCIKSTRLFASESFPEPYFQYKDY